MKRAMLASLPPEAATPPPTELRPAWRTIARPEQLAPGTPGAADARKAWSFWLLLAGRGVGKTRSGAEWAIEQARDRPGSHGAIVAPTADDARKTMLSEGMEHMPEASGILAVSPPDFRPVYRSTHRRLVWPNGSIATLYSAEEPDRLRGPQHHWGWLDEVAAWEREQEAFDQFLFGLRLGSNPQACITTTPRPIPIVKRLVADPDCVITRGRTADNAANLSPLFLAKVVARYEGTRLGRQELGGELLDEIEGALWTLKRIDALRVAVHPKLRRIVVAIDPAVSNNEGSDETGIIVVGAGPCSCKGGPPEIHGFVLDDLSGKHSPDEWAKLAIGAYRTQKADRIIAEINNGGALVEANLRTVDRNAAYKGVHAAQGKRTRAEPVAALYEQGKVHHVGTFEKLEDQLSQWEPFGTGRSPDRLDALVWGCSELLLLDRESTAERWFNAGRPNGAGSNLVG